ncbi:MAG: Na+/H+ antiporter NhaA [Epsilonproteobacteria bacterium]|nr:Na+/H+ antiporter NhaA [Campylobacterota bacterium]
MNTPLSDQSTTPISALSRQLESFLHLEAASGFVLLLFALIALVWANSPFSSSYFEMLHLTLSVSIGAFGFETTLLHIVNDAIMCIFFFIIGLELKREFVEGELRNPKEATLPIVAAIGGMVIPALLFLLASDDASRNGWAIPAATDIAFAVGIMALLSDRIPVKLKVFLLTLAVADDIGAIVIIALFYSHGFDPIALFFAIAMLTIMVVLYRIGVRHLLVFFMVAALSWSFLLASGIHSTLLGVLLGLMAPSTPDLSKKELFTWVQQLKEKINELIDSSDAQIKTKTLHAISETSYASMSMLQKLELYFHPWNIFYVLPLFALFNAGFIFDLSAFSSPASIGIMLGLIIGKPLGIIAFSYLAHWLGIVKIEFTFAQVAGVGLLAGIGFTMSIFISVLAFEDPMLKESAKGAIFVASVISGIAGYSVLRYFTGKQEAQANADR